MRSRLIRVTATTFVVIAVSLQLAAQEQHAVHHHYKLIDIGTFGGLYNYKAAMIFSLHI